MNPVWLKKPCLPRLLMGKVSARAKLAFLRTGQRSSVVEQLIRNQQVTGSNPVVGSLFLRP